MERDSNQKRLDDLRERLYARSSEDGERPVRTELTRQSRPDVPRDWKQSQKDLEATLNETPTQKPQETQTMPVSKKRKAFRKKILIVGGVFFAGAIVLSTLFLILGNNSISGENISLEATGPFAIGGAEKVDMRVALQNNNAVPIESATLIVEYPLGTQSGDGEGIELFTERRPIDNIEPGQVVTEKFSAMVFGEENTEKIINISVEYRVHGSSAIFYKEAEPLRLKVSSSPIVLRVVGPQNVTSGQEVELTLDVASNTDASLSDVLISVEYPFGFEFEEASIDPVAGNTVWRIDELDPENQETITITGFISGLQDEDRVFRFSAGVGAERDRFALSSVYATAEHEMSISTPSLNVGVTINNKADAVVVLPEGQSATVYVEVQNTLDETIYNATVDVSLGGNILNQLNVGTTNGFYDANRNIISFDRNSVSNLKEIPPGDSRGVSFTIIPQSGIGKTSEISLDVAITAGQSSRGESDLSRNAERTIQISSPTSLSSEVRLVSGSSTPTEGEESRYAIDLIIENGSNELVNGVLTAVLPPYVSLDNQGGDLSYDASTRTLTWTVGSVGAGKKRQMAALLSFTPTSAHVGKTPTLIEIQRLKATNRFTGLTVRAEAGAIVTPKEVE